MINRNSVLGALAVLFALMLGQVAAAQAPSASTPPVKPVGAAAVEPGSAEYVIGPEDVVEAEVVGQPDRLRARVYTDGTIQLNLVGKVTAAGKTSRQLGDEIARLLKSGGYYSNPVVNVEVVSYTSRYVTVLGAIGSPGLVPINRPYRMSEILARVGGVQERAADYLLVRPQTGPEKRFSIAKLSTGDSNDDPYVTPGDKIFVPTADLFYISGQVGSPGTFPLKEGMTLREAIARAGGLGPAGTDHGILVTRGGKKLKLDVGAKVEPNDVIVVRERLF